MEEYYCVRCGEEISEREFEENECMCDECFIREIEHRELVKHPDDPNQI